MKSKSTVRHVIRLPEQLAKNLTVELLEYKEVGWRVCRLWRGSHAVTGRKPPEVLEQEQKRIELEEEAWEKMLQKDAEMRGHREAHEAVLKEAGIPSPYVQSAPGSSEQQ